LHWRRGPHPRRELSLMPQALLFVSCPPDLPDPPDLLTHVSYRAYLTYLPICCLFSDDAQQQSRPA
jgi:hypothetical protein